jgi:hypothetical protein
MRAKTIGLSGPVSLVGTGHNHIPNPDKITADRIRNKIIERGITTTEPPMAIINQCQRDLPISCATVIQSDHNLAQSIRSNRRKKTDKEATRREDIVNAPHLTRTIEDEGTLIYLDF